MERLILAGETTYNYITECLEAKPDKSRDLARKYYNIRTAKVWLAPIPADEIWIVNNDLSAKCPDDVSLNGIVLILRALEE